ncbi:MAG: hypothetical protein WBV96_10700, partial [Polyangia bacterium]
NQHCPSDDVIEKIANNRHSRTAVMPQRCLVVDFLFGAPGFEECRPLLTTLVLSGNDVPFSDKPAAELATRFYTMLLRRDCQLQRQPAPTPVSGGPTCSGHCRRHC